MGFGSEGQLGIPNLTNEYHQKKFCQKPTKILNSIKTMCCGAKYALAISFNNEEQFMNIIIDEFTQIYNEKELEPVKYQYKDIVKWQNEYENSEAYINSKKYWNKVYEDEIPVF